jgi:hypothetical protein
MFVRSGQVRSGLFENQTMQDREPPTIYLTILIFTVDKSSGAKAKLTAIRSDACVSISEYTGVDI